MFLGEAMRRFLVSALAVILFVAAPQTMSARAVENGIDAIGNGYVVPVLINKGASWGSCSGALIASTIVVTAGHCAVDANGLVTNKIYVGRAGSAISSVKLDDIVQKVEITSTYTDGANSTVGDDDLAFLVLTKPQTLTMPIRLASETEASKYKSSKTALKAFGYGCYTDDCKEDTSGPKSYIGNFSQAAAPYANSAFIESTNGHTCKGDSGGPIIATTPTTAILVGIVSGATMNVNCAKRLADGNYYGLFTLIGRYANLAFGAASSSISDLQGKNADLSSEKTELQNTVTELKTQYATATSKSTSLADDLATATAQIEELQAEVQSLRASLPSTITCLKGRLAQKVTAVKPKCPSGFKLKP